MPATPSLKLMKYLLSSSPPTSQDFPARHLSTFSGNNSHSSFMKDSLSFHRVCCCLKDSVKGVLTVAPGGESLPRRFNNTSGRNNVSGLNRKDGSHPPVASADIYSLALVPQGDVQLGGGYQRWKVNMDFFLRGGYSVQF